MFWNSSRLAVSTMTVCMALGIAALAPVAVFAAGAQADTAALEKQLAEARKRLDADAHEVARLSEALYGHDADILKFARGGRPGAMLGVNVGGSAAREEGVEVVAVSPGGPAERAGLAAGDVILSVDGRSLTKSAEGTPASQLVGFMRTVEPGQSVKVEYLRDGKRKSVDIEAAPAMPPIALLLRDRMLRAMPENLDLPPIHMLLGPEQAFGSLELVPVTPKLGQYFGADTGLLVVRGPRSGSLPLEDGDVLLTIGGRTPGSPGQAFRILRSYEPGDKVKLGVLRNRKRIELEATIPAEPELGGHRLLPGPAAPAAPPRPAPPAPPGKSNTTA